MKLQNQVCTLDQAKRLKKLGIAQDSLFSWCGEEDHIPAGETERWVWVGRTEPANNQEEEGRDLVVGSGPFAAAFTVAELGVMLPEWLLINNREYRLSQWQNRPEQYSELFRSTMGTEEWRLAYRGGANSIITEIGDNIKGPTEAQARAAMLIYLLEDKLITAEDVNKRLAE